MIGMQKANQGMQNMKGYEDRSFQSPVQLHEAEAGHLEATVFGNEINMHDFAEKKKKLEELEAYNFFSSLGKGLADTVTAITQTLIDFISGLI